MLEALRRNSRNTIIYVLFGVIIAVFVINFGPGSRGCAGGAATSYAAKVDGDTVTEAEFRYAFMITGSGNLPPQYLKALRRKEVLMDKLIEREILAREAERLGIHVSAKEAEDMVASGKLLALGVERKVDDYVFVDGRFDYDHLRAVCQNRLGVTVAKFIEQQQRELMAERVRQLMLASTKVSPDEAKASFERDNTTADLEFVKFQPRRYADQVAVTPADVDAYKKAHDADLRKYYEEHPYLYKKVDKEAHLGRVLVAVAKDAPADKVAAARAKADEAAKKLQAGASLADVAKQFSDDDRSKARGGDMGWPRKGTTGFGAALDTLVWNAKKGDLLGPERDDRGFEVLRVEDFREGDIPFEAVADEIADEQLRSDKAKALAKADAEAAMAKVKAGAKLDVLYPKPSDADEGDPTKRATQVATQTTGPFARKSDVIPELGPSSDLMKQVFAMKAGDTFGPTEVAGSWVIGRVKERKDPDMAEFEKSKAELAKKLERERWTASLEAWSKDRCVELRDAGKIKVSDEVLAYDGSAKPEMPYTACGGNRMPMIPGLM